MNSWNDELVRIWSTFSDILQRITINVPHYPIYLQFDVTSIYGPLCYLWSHAAADPGFVDGGQKFVFITKTFFCCSLTLPRATVPGKNVSTLARPEWPPVSATGQTPRNDAKVYLLYASMYSIHLSRKQPRWSHLTLTYIHTRVPACNTIKYWDVKTGS